MHMYEKQHNVNYLHPDVKVTIETIFHCQHIEIRDYPEQTWRKRTIREDSAYLKKCDSWWPKKESVEDPKTKDIKRRALKKLTVEEKLALGLI